MFAPHSVCSYFAECILLAINLSILLQEFKTLPLLIIPHHLMGFWVLFFLRSKVSPVVQSSVQSSGQSSDYR